MFTAQFSRELDEINKMLLQLGGMVEDSLRKAIKAAREGDPVLGKEVVKSDNDIDSLELEVEEECLKVMALHQPVAKDLRYLVAVLKINSDLERIGDLAVNISKRSKLLAREPGFELPETFTQMCDATCRMLTKVLNAFVEFDVNAAKEVFAQDEEVDEANKAIYNLVKGNLKSGGEHPVQNLHLLTMSRHIERAADHVTNIAEDIIYMLSGDIVRHNKDRI